MQWEHYGPEEATWELEDSMQLAHPFLFKFCKRTKDSAIEGGGDCNTLVLTPLALNIHDTYIVNNHGAELKAKAPPSIGYVMFWIEILTDGISGHVAYILSCGIM